MEQPLPPRDFLRRHRLPQLVRIHNPHLHLLDASLDINQPFLLNNAYTTRQVLAYTLIQASPPSSCEPSLKKNGPPLLIPESYPGELRVLSSIAQAKQLEIILPPVEVVFAYILFPIVSSSFVIPAVIFNVIAALLFGLIVVRAVCGYKK